MVHRRRFLVFSLANWALAVALWSISAYLGITSPTSLFVYSVLFVVALVAVVVGIISWLVWRFGRDPQPVSADSAPPAGGAESADTGDQSVPVPSR